MKTKQIVGIVVAAVMFTLVCATSAIVDSYTAERTSSLTETMKSVVKEKGAYSFPGSDFMGVVNVNGTIQEGAEESIFSTTTGYNHKKLMKYVDELEGNDNNKGIILLLDTPGGSVYETDEMYLRLLKYKENTGRPIYAYVQHQACSGGYYMAMAADKIYANRNGMTGSIGVIMSLMNMKDLYKKLGIEEVNITSGKNKAMGSVGSEMTKEQKDILQSMVDEAYEQFIQIVAKGRNMDVEKVKKLADGRVYSTLQAEKAGLIDKVATYEEFTDFVAGEMGEDIKIYNPSEEEKDNIFAELFSKVKDIQPKSESQVLVELLEREGKGGLLYYAE